MARRALLLVPLFFAVSLRGQDLIGRPAYDFSLTDTRGQTVRLSELKGKTVVLDFWTTWCPPCREELPLIGEISRSFADKAVAVLGVDGAEDPETVGRFMGSNLVPYRTLLTFDDTATLEEYGVRSFPFIVIVDRNGIIAEARSYPAKELVAALSAKLADLQRPNYESPVAAPRSAQDLLPGLIQPKAATEPLSHPPEAPLLRAALNLRMSRLDEALRNVDAYLAGNDKSQPALRLRAEIYGKQRKFAEAIADCTTILGQSPGDSKVYEQRAKLFMSSNNPEKALPDFERQTQLDPGNSEAWRNLAAAYLRKGSLDQANRAIERALDLAPDRIASYQLRAEIEKQQANWRAELADIDRMLLLEPNNNWARTYRPDILLRISQTSAPSSQEDAYAVYSTALLHPIWDHADNDRFLLIAQTTGQAYGSMDPKTCIQPPAEYHKAMDELLADYAEHKAEKIQLRPEFRISRPYKLLTDEQADLFQKSRFGNKPVPDPDLARLFAQSPDIIRLGQVLFNRDHTLGIVLVSNWCGGLCGGQQWRVFFETRSGVDRTALVALLDHLVTALRDTVIFEPNR